MLARLLAFAALLVLTATTVEAANKFAVCTTACTWDVANADNVWRTTTGGGTATSIPGTTDTAIFDAATCVGGTTCTITVNATIAVQGITMGACTASTTGCILNFATNNNNVTLSVAMSITGTGVRELRMGNGTWTLTGLSGNIWDATTVTNYTQTPNGSTLAVAGVGGGSGRNVITGGKTFNALTLSELAATPAAVSLTGSGTFASVAVTAPFVLFFSAGTTTTITAAFTWAGTAFNNVISVNGTGAAANVAVGASGATCTWCTLSKVIFTTNAVNATNSFDMKGNNMNGGAITGPASGGGGGGAPPFFGGF